MKIKKERLIKIIKEEVKTIKEMGAYNRGLEDPIDDDPTLPYPEEGGIQSMYAGRPDSINQIEDAIFEVIEMIDKHGSDPDLVDAYVAFLRAIEEGGVNLQALFTQV